MNVATWMGVGGTTDAQVALLGGRLPVAGGTQSSPFGALLALELSHTLQPGEDASFSLTGSEGEELTAQQLGELLAILQELLAVGIVQQAQTADAQPVVDSTDESGEGPVQNSLLWQQGSSSPGSLALGNTVSADFSLLANQMEVLLRQMEPTLAANGWTPETLAESSHQNKQVLIATFTKQGMSLQQATRLVESMALLSEAGKRSQQPDIRSAALKLAQFLDVAGRNPDPNQGGKPSGNVHSAQMPNGNARTGWNNGFVQAARTTPHLEGNNVQTFRLQRALNTYAAEVMGPLRQQAVVKQEQPGVISLAQAANDTTQSQPAAGVSVSQSANPLPAPHVASTLTPQQVPVPSEQLVERVSQFFVKQLLKSDGEAVHEAKFILYPRSLGQVDVKITSHNGVITAQFFTDTQSGKELLDNQLPQLRAALVQQGLQVDRLEVSQQQNSQPQFSFQQQREQGKQQPFQQQRQDLPTEDEQTAFSLEALTEGTDLVTAWKRARMAGSINYSA